MGSLAGARRATRRMMSAERPPPPPLVSMLGKRAAAPVDYEGQDEDDHSGEEGEG